MQLCGWYHLALGSNSGLVGLGVREQGMMLESRTRTGEM